MGICFLFSTNLYKLCLNREEAFLRGVTRSWLSLGFTIAFMSVRACVCVHVWQVCVIKDKWEEDLRGSGWGRSNKDAPFFLGQKDLWSRSSLQNHTHPIISTDHLDNTILGGCTELPFGLTPCSLSISAAHSLALCFSYVLPTLLSEFDLP